MLIEKEVLRSCCGQNEEGMGNAVVMIEAKIFHPDREEEKAWDILFDDPVVNIQRAMRFTTVDLTFDSPLNIDYVRAMKELSDFSVVERSADDENFPGLVLTIMPDEYDGEYYCTGLYGAWTLIPSRPNSNADTIRFIFDNDFFQVYHASQEAYEGEDDE